MTTTITRAVSLGAAARDHLLPVEQSADGIAYRTEPRGCRCVGGPRRDAREPWFVVCIKRGAVLSMRRPG